MKCDKCNKKSEVVIYDGEKKIGEFCDYHQLEFAVAHNWDELKIKALVKKLLYAGVNEEQINILFQK